MLILSKIYWLPARETGGRPPPKRLPPPKKTLLPPKVKTKERTIETTAYCFAS